MLKKAEVIDALNNGAHIHVNDIYRSATVWTADGQQLGTCRFDTAQRLGKTEGFKIRKLDAWSFSWNIEKEQPETIEEPEEETTMKEEKVLYFEGAGCVPRGDMENCRIRTAFTLDNGKQMYLEIIGSEVTKHMHESYRRFENAAFVDFCFYITGGPDDCNESRHPAERKTHFEYCHSEVLRFVNSLGASFTRVEVLPDLAGYRVHRDGGGYNYGDTFQPDEDAIKEREAIHAEIYNRDKAAGIEFPCFSLWVDPIKTNVLHYRNYRANNERADFITGTGETAADMLKKLEGK